MYVSHNAGKKQEKRFLSQRADHEVSSLEESGDGTLCLLFVSGLFSYCVDFSHRGFFRAGVWAHPAKLIMYLAPALCVRVCCWWKVHGYGWNVLRWKLYVLVNGGCMWLWLFAGVHNDAKQVSWEGEVRVAGALWTMDGREGGGGVTLY